MRTKPIPYSKIPVNIGGDTLFYDPSADDPRPYCPEHGLMAMGADCWYCEDCDKLPDEQEVVAEVLSRAEFYSDQWEDRGDDYWFQRLAQEVGELGSTLADDHGDPPEHELMQIASIAINWLQKRARERTTA